MVNVLKAAPARPPHEAQIRQIALFTAAGSSVAVLFSIAASQILLGAALAALILSRTTPRLPPVWPPLAAFMALTVVSLLASGNPVAGLPQIRKFFVYLTLITIFTTIRDVSRARLLALCWAAAAALGAAVSLVQFARKAHEAHVAGRPLYEYYVTGRVTGFMSHWQTFGGEQMIVALVLVAFLLFSPRARGRLLWAGLAAIVLLGAALLADYTRGVWLGVLCGGAYLLWSWRRLALFAIPAFAVLLVLINPGGVGTRAESMLHPNGDLDSNQFRIVCWKTGAEMIKAHPWLGLGPQIVQLKFMDYVPADIPRPLPTGWYGHLHNLYIHYAAERGIPAALALIAVLLKVLWDFGSALRRSGRAQSDAAFLLHGAIAAVLAVMISGLFEVNLGDSEVLTLFLAVVAVGYAAAAEARLA